MKRTIPIIILLLIIFSVVNAQPKVGLGLKVTRNLFSWGSSYPDIPFGDDWTSEYYWGIGGDLYIKFTRFFILRIEAIQFKIYSNNSSEGDGGFSYNIFSKLNADAILVIPVNCRISPLIVAGITYEKFFNKPINDQRSLASPYEIRLGLGTQYKLKEKMNVLFEIQLYNKTQEEVTRNPYDPYDIYYTTLEIIGFPRINLGICFEL